MHRTDRQQPFYSESRSSNIKQLRNILLTYVQYNNDLGYCQVRCPVPIELDKPMPLRPSCTLVFIQQRVSEVTVAGYLCCSCNAAWFQS